MQTMGTASHQAPMLEPHTYDDHDEPQAPDCASQCSAALLEIINYILAGGSSCQKSQIRLAAIAVELKRLKPTEAVEIYGVSRSSVYKHRKSFRKHLGTF